MDENSPVEMLEAAVSAAKSANAARHFSHHFVAALAVCFEV